MATLQMVKKYSIGSTLVLGEPQSGRTSWVIKKLIDKKVLWVSFNNLGTIAEADTFAEGSKLVLVNDYKQDVPAISAEEKYDAVVLDGLNYASGMWFTANIGARQPTQQEWGVMSNALAKLILDMRAVAPVYCIIDVEKDADGNNQIGLNRAAIQNIVGLFDLKVRTVIRDIVKPDAKTGTVNRTKTYEVLTGDEAIKVK